MFGMAVFAMGADQDVHVGKKHYAGAVLVWSLGRVEGV